MRPMKNFRKTLLAVCTLVGLMFAQNAAALVTVNASSAADGTTQSVGFTFDVDVSVTWDGGQTGPGDTFQGVFTSHTWDSSQLTLIGVAGLVGPPGMFDVRPNIMAGTSFLPTMAAVGDINTGLAGDDITTSARTVQYAAPGAIDSTRATTDITVRLTFQIVGAGDGVAEVTGTNLISDAGAVGDSFAFGTNVAVTVPEPTSAMLALSAIGSVFAVVSLSTPRLSASFIWS